MGLFGRIDSAKRAEQPAFAVVDLETTGLFPVRSDRIVEIALVVVTPQGDVIDEWSTLVNPERDIGPTSVHGLTSRQVEGAPRFGEIVGDILERVDDRILVGHNVRFDVGFLESEMERAGHTVHLMPSMCTMSLASQLRLPGRSLTACCEAIGVLHERGHEAREDARATAALLIALLAMAARNRQAVEIPPPLRSLPRLPSTAGFVLRGTHLARPVSRISALLDQMPTTEVPTGIDPAAVLSYMALLDRVLEDRRLTDDEVAALGETAHSWGLNRDAAARIHGAYFDGLLSIALADGVISDREREDLVDVAELLGVGDVARSIEKVDSSLPLVVNRAAEFQGLSVCFTGESVCALDGDPMDRATQERLALNAGMVVIDNVTKKLDVLVLADPTSQSGKARKATEYGVRKIAERSFWTALGIHVD